MEAIPNLRTLRDILAYGQAVGEHRPWPRVVVSREAWQHTIGLLQDGQCTLLGLWGDKDLVHIALVDEERSEPGILSFACEGNKFPSVGRLHAPAIRLERAVRDLSGLEPEGPTDTRAWLDHGKWPVQRPLGQMERVAATSQPYSFLPAEGESLHQIPVGPVHAGIIEPVTSASRRAARRSCAWRRASATCTRGSNRSWRG
jgi:hypothetical protein